MRKPHFIYTNVVLMLCMFFVGCEDNGNRNEIRWLDCGYSDAKCGEFSVPLDHSNPIGEQIKLVLFRVPATGTKKGSLFINPGGPGASAVEYIKYFSETPTGKRLLNNFDLIGFDPRGVGLSSPISCVNNVQHYLGWELPKTIIEYFDVIAVLQEYGEKCLEKNGNLLSHVGSIDVIQDMELLRKALGEGKLNYIGLSYGSKLGALYAEKYPEYVRAMVLDGALPTSLNILEISLGQIAGFERSLQAFLRSCANNSLCSFGEGNPEAALWTLLSDIEEEPLPTDDGRLLTRSEAEAGIILDLYHEVYWPELEEALTLAWNGDGSLLQILSDIFYGRNLDGTYSNENDIFNAVVCIDSSPITEGEVIASLPEAEITSPFFGETFMYSNLACTFWPVPPTLKPVLVTAKGAPQIMVVGTTGDPATPYTWAKKINKELNSSFLVTYHAETHTALGQNKCVDDQYEKYLLTPDILFPNIDCSTINDKTALKETNSTKGIEQENFKRQRFGLR